MTENNPSDHAAENASDVSSDTLPEASPVKEKDPTTPIIRSAYKSDVENNDDLPDGNSTSPVLYTGDATYGVVHVIDSTDEKPTIHMWLGMIHLWPLTVETLRKRGYDTFHFTPYSSRENWMKMYPEMNIAAVIKPKEKASPSKAVARKSTKNDDSIIGEFRDIFFTGSYFSISVKLLLLGGVMYFTAMLGHNIGYNYEHSRYGKRFSYQKKSRTSPYAYKGGLFGEGQQQCLATDNNELGLREKTEILFGGNKKSDEEHAEALISWLKKEGGYFHPNLQMRRVDPSDPTSYFGMFVNDFIPEGEVILRVPRSMVLDSTEKNPDAEVLTCKTVRNLIDQLKLKDESKYAPYVNYLIDTQPPGIPSAWSQAGKDLFNRVIDPSDFVFPWVDKLVPAEWSGVAKDFLSLVKGHPKNVMELPPYDPFQWLEEWHESCKGSDDPLEEYAALIVIQRSWDDKLIPVFDMMSHRNGHWLNTAHSDVHDTDIDVEVKASRDIKANEQIYTSYNMCESCGNRNYEYGTESILREYGFVEQMPQSFYFPEMQFGYRLEENWKTSAKGAGFGKAYVTEWVYKEPDDDDVETMKQMLRQISWKKATELSKQCGVNDNEWETINNYVNALENGLKAAVKAIEKGGGGIEVVGEEELVGTDGDSDDDE